MTSTGNLRLDSVEYLSSVPRNIIKESLTEFGQQILAQNPEINRVVAGDISQEALKGMFRKTHMLEIMEEGLDYGDAKNQSLIAERPHLIEKLEEYRSSDEDVHKEKEVVAYLGHYAADPDFLGHLIQESEKKPWLSQGLHPWSVQFLISFNQHPTLEQLSDYYSWLEKDSDYANRVYEYGRCFYLTHEVLDSWNRSDYQQICAVPFETITLFEWDDIMAHSTLNEITQLALLLGKAKMNRRNFPPIDLTKISPENLPKNYNRVQFFTMLLILAQESGENLIHIPFEQLIEHTRNFIEQQNLHDPKKIAELTSEGVYTCCMIKYKDGNPLISFRELMTIGEPEIDEASGVEEPKMTTYSSDDSDDDDTYTYYNKPLSKKEIQRKNQCYGSLALIKVLTSEKAISCYAYIDKDGKPFITFKELADINFVPNIESAIERLTSKAVIQALHEGLFTGADVVEHPYIFNEDVIQALKDKIYNIDELKKNLGLRQSEVIQALRDNLYSVSELKTCSEVLSDSEIITFLRERKEGVVIDISEMIKGLQENLYTKEDVKKNPRYFFTPAIVQALRENLYSVKDVKQSYSLIFSHVIQALGEGLYKLDDIKKDINHCFDDIWIVQALQENLYSLSDIKENPALFKSYAVRSALLQKLFSFADLKAHPEIFTNVVVIKDLERGLLDVVDLKKGRNPDINAPRPREKLFRSKSTASFFESSDRLELASKKTKDDSQDLKAKDDTAINTDSVQRRPRTSR